jgi:hypothetical protein
MKLFAFAIKNAAWLHSDSRRRELQDIQLPPHLRKLDSRSDPTLRRKAQDPNGSQYARWRDLSKLQQANSTASR